MKEHSLFEEDASGRWRFVFDSSDVVPTDSATK